MNKKLTIFTIADSFAPNIGGMEKVAEYSAIQLGKEHNSVLFAPKVKGYKDNLPIKVIRVKSFPIEKPRLMLTLPKLDGKLKKFVKENPPDIIHVHNQSPLSKWFLKYGKKHNIPTFMTIHGYLENDINATKFSFLKKGLIKYFVKTIKLADTIFAVSKGNKKYYEQFDFTPTLLRNATDAMIANEAYAEELKLKFNIKPNDNVLCFVNRLLAIKNIDMMFKALKILKDKNFKFKALIAGDGDKKQDAEKFVTENNLNNCVFFLGNIRDRSHVASIYKISNLHLFPSVKDNASLSIGESASQNTPTLAIRGCSSVELIKEEKNGFLTENTPEDYAKKIIEIFKDKNNIDVVGKNARKTLYFTWEDYEKQVLGYYYKSLK